MAESPFPKMERILLAVDEFNPSKEAVAWTGWIARRTGAAVDALTVVPKLPRLLRFDLQMDSGAGTRLGVERLDSAAGGALERLEQSAALRGLAVRPHVGHGDALGQILSFQESLRPSLVVVGAHGSATLHGHLGSVADRLRSRARAPLLVARGKPRNGLGIVVGADGSRHADRAIAMATMLARTLDWPLEVLEAGFRDASEPSQAPRLPHVTTYTRSPLPPAMALLRAAEGGQLIVVGARGHRPVSVRLMGSVSDEVSREAPGPVLVVH